MSRARLRQRLAPQIAAALILSSLGSCAPSRERHGDGECEQSISEAQLPPAVAAALQREAAGARIVEIERQITSGRTTFSAEVLKDGISTDIVFAEDGSVLSRIQE